MFASRHSNLPGMLVLSAAISLVGCGSDGTLQEVVVSGQVTYRGEPVQEGEIRFVPIGKTKGPANIGLISEGRYTITARGGVPVGTHRVEIQAYKPLPGAKPYTEAQADGKWGIEAGDLPKGQYLPNQYNKKSMLKVTVEADSGRVTKDFDLR